MTQTEIFVQSTEFLYNKPKTLLICCPPAKTDITIDKHTAILGEFCFYKNKSEKLIIPEGIEFIEKFFVEDADIKIIKFPKELKGMNYLSLGNGPQITSYYAGSDDRIIEILKEYTKFVGTSPTLDDILAQIDSLTEANEILSCFER